MLFPELAGKRFGYLNLNEESRRWLTRNKIKSKDPNPLLDPAVSDRMVREAHQVLDLDWSYGGWMEDRSDKLRGAYVEATGNFLHLGVDFNVPAGTKVASDDLRLVLRVIPDVPEPGGWGTRVILKSFVKDEVIVYGHLAPNVRCHEGQTVDLNEVFATVGDSAQNGGWFPHLHVQCIEGPYYRAQLNEGELEFDGYGHPNDRMRLAKIFGDPMRCVSLR